jgi:hypothetical protein
MKLECPKCDSNVVQVLLGIDDSRYAMCFGCGELTHFKRRRIASEKTPTPASSGRDTAHSQSDRDNPPKVMWRPVDYRVRADVAGAATCHRILDAIERLQAKAPAEKVH